MKGTYLEILPQEILEIIYLYVNKLYKEDVLKELKYETENAFGRQNKYLQVYNSLISKVERSFHGRSKIIIQPTTYISVYFNKWFRTYYFNDDRLNCYNGNIIIDPHIIHIIHTYDLLHLYVDSSLKLKQTLYRLEYYDLVSLKNFNF